MIWLRHCFFFSLTACRTPTAFSGSYSCGICELSVATRITQQSSACGLHRGHRETRCATDCKRQLKGGTSKHPHHTINKTPTKKRLWQSTVVKGVLKLEHNWHKSPQQTFSRVIIKCGNLVQWEGCKVLNKDFLTRKWQKKKKKCDRHWKMPL